ncbi:hypothetical protein M404DRAFT_1001236 [Pisolithus tinctorius Marx 270]|uniref:Uncharacterized protein n=1 Tax=Pisolithus tinctorius Marx 270 TaxID=870435 RepID=A0A0C3NSA4_PISTI|nr:hypothetical protein M404DRAFT_1001236 [Pisolithus tinctorius Marx 270]
MPVLIRARYAQTSSSAFVCSTWDKSSSVERCQGKARPGGYEARSCVDIGILHRIGYVPFQVDDNDDRISKCPDGGISCEVSRLEMGNNQGGL